MKRTIHFDFPYFEEGDRCDPVYDIQRWVTIDKNLGAVMSVLGHGIIEGWDISYDADSLTVSVSGGKGLIAGLEIESINTSTIELLPDSENHLYVNLAHEDKNETLTITAHLTPENHSRSLSLGCLTTDENGVSGVDLSDRRYVCSYDKVSFLLREHKHSGEKGCPSKIDLSKDVVGKLKSDHLRGIDAALVNRGKLHKDRIPRLSHSDMDDGGTLSHQSIDEILLDLKDNKSAIGEAAIANLMQLYISLKPKNEKIDFNCVNQHIIVPGCYPFMGADNYADPLSTAVIDEDNHVFYNVSSKKASRFYTKLMTLNGPLNRIMVTYKGQVEYPQDFVQIGLTDCETTKDEDYTFIPINRIVDWSSYTGQIKLMLRMRSEMKIVINGIAFMYSE